MAVKKRLIRQVIDFLTLLEDSYPNVVEFSILQDKFRSDYNRIVEYLTRRGKEGKQLIFQNNEKTGWRLNNWYIDEIREIISRSTNDFLLQEQSKLFRKQNYFNLVIAVTGSIVSLLMLFDFMTKYFNLNMTDIPAIGQLLIFLFMLLLGMVLVIFVYKHINRI